LCILPWPFYRGKLKNCRMQYSRELFVDLGILKSVDVTDNGSACLFTGRRRDSTFVFVLTGGIHLGMLASSLRI
jgi:hypothetical protein